MLPLETPVGVSGGAAADATGCRTVHVLPRFVLLGPNAAAPAATEAPAAAGGAGGRGPSGGGTAGAPTGAAAGPAAGAAAGGTAAAAAAGAAAVAEGAEEGAPAEELRPSELDRLLRAPPPSVLGWMVGAREAAAGVAWLGLGLGLGSP